LKRLSIDPRFVEFIPDQLEDGALYISVQFNTVVHKCCCGCGEEVVTPLSPVEWQLRTNDNLVTLYPSVGNWNFQCQSHYWIRNNHVIWAGAMSENKIRRVQERDRLDKELYIEQLNEDKINKTRQQPMIYRVWSWLCNIWR